MIKILTHIYNNNDINLANSSILTEQLSKTQSSDILIKLFETYANKLRKERDVVVFGLYFLSSSSFFNKSYILFDNNVPSLLDYGLT